MTASNLKLPPGASITIDLAAREKEGPLLDIPTAIYEAIDLARAYNCTVTLKRSDYVSVDLNSHSGDDFILLNEAEAALSKYRMEPNADDVFISMRSGSTYFPLKGESRPDVPYEDIALGLARTARFNGQTTHFYSVAQHSVLVSRRVAELTDDPEIILKGLCHDMSESFTGDLISPLKALMPKFKELERKIEDYINDSLGLAHVDYSLIKRADLELLATEKRDLMPNSKEDWKIIEGIDPLPYEIKALSPDDAFDEFIREFDRVNALVQQYRYQSVAQVKEASASVENGHALTASGYAQIIDAISKINTTSPSNEVLSNLSEYHTKLHSAMLLHGLNSNDSNAIFMGRKKPDNIEGLDAQTTRLLGLMEQCGNVCREMFERISIEHQRKFFNPREHQPKHIGQSNACSSELAF